jgi:hypothetical protein
MKGLTFGKSETTFIQASLKGVHDLEYIEVISVTVFN